MYVDPICVMEIKTKEQALKIIRGVKQTRGRLRNKMEHPDYPFGERIICPSDLTVYRCKRDFLERLILRYIELGGEYKKSKSEIKDEDFNDSIKDIKKITFCRAPFLGFEKGKRVVALSKGKVEIFEESFGELIPFETDVCIEDFLYDFGKLHIGEWRKRYTTNRFGVYVLDGKWWELDIEYKNGRKRKYCGENAYPYNFGDLESLLKLGSMSHII